MHKIFLLLLIGAGYITETHGQSKSSYYIYYFNYKAGVTDTAAKEVLPPLYRNDSKANEFYWELMENDTSRVLFNPKNGQHNQYKRITSYAVKLEDGYYTHVQQYNGPALLINSQTGNTVELSRDYTNHFKRENNYLFAYYTIPDPAIKNGKSTRIDVLDVRNKFKPVVTGAYEFVQLLYKTGTQQKTENTYVPFDAIVFSEDNQHQLYDKDLKLVKTFFSQKTSGEELALVSSRILLHKVLSTYKELPSNESSPGLEVVPRLPIGPAKLVSEKTDGNSTVVYLERKKNPAIVLFTTTANVYLEDNKVKVYQVNDKREKTAEATFEVDLNTGRCLLPAAYWKPLNMKALP